MKMGDTVRWLEVKEPGGWAGNGKAKIVGFDKARRYFRGMTPATPESPPTGPAVQIELESLAISHPALAIVWVTPDDLMPWLEQEAA